MAACYTHDYIVVVVVAAAAVVVVVVRHHIVVDIVVASPAVAVVDNDCWREVDYIFVAGLAAETL